MENLIAQIKTELLEDVQKQLAKSYGQQFNTEIWLSANYPLQTIFAKQIDKFNPENILAQFYIRHEWLKPHDEDAKTVNPKSLSYQFLYKTLSDALISCLTPATACKSWADISKEQIASRNFQWTKIDKLTELISDYPFSNVEAFYCQQRREDHPNFECSSDLDWLNHKLTRVDLFRLLANHYPDELKTCPRIAPLALRELMFLTAKQKNQFQTLLINIGTNEKDARWVLLHKKEDQWTVYVPDFFPDVAPWLEQQVLPGVKQVKVDYQDNLGLNDITDLSEETTWHAVLLCRVLPWLKQSKEPKLENYRPRVPLPILLQQALVQSLSAQVSQKQLEMTNAFNYRHPFTPLHIREFLPAPKPLQHLLAHPQDYPYLMDTDLVSRVLRAFDEKTFIIADGLQAFIITEKGASATQLSDALSLIYQHRIASLTFSPSADATACEIRALFDLDVNLKTIKPYTQAPYNHMFAKFRPLFQHASSCAARNRFLPQTNTIKRNELWQAAGQAIVEFFQQNSQALDVDKLKSATEFNQDWLKTYCDHEKRGQLSDLLWSFVQITHMGQMGLDAMFDYLDKHFTPKTAPNLPFILDIGGSLTVAPEDYIDYLIKKFTEFKLKNPDCSPLFSSLSLILPATLNEKSQQALLKLIKTEISEINVYNLNINNPDSTSSAFTKALDDLAKKDLQLSLRFPDWDQQAYIEPAHQVLKASYRQVQNQIMDNRRSRACVVLPENTKSIYACAKGELKPEIQLDEQLERQAQLWDGEDIYYPLSAQNSGIQQQLSQTIEQEFAQEQQQEQEQEQTKEVELEIEMPILPYSGDENELINRSNIEKQGRYVWDKVPDEIKRLSGIKENDLSQLFSLWVGSEQDAAEVIAGMEPAAVQKIMQNANHFRMGLSRNAMPAGFYLCYSNKGLILCFNEQRRQEDLAALSVKQRNPFTVELHHAKITSEFCGDMRQLSQISEQIDQQHSLWNILALDSHPPKQQKIKKPTNYGDCLRCLSQWAGQFKPSKELLNALFNEKHKTVLTEANLKAFGQLFNHYDALAAKPKGTAHWFVINQQLFEAFGPVHFATWKTRFLDVSKNWADYLEKAEVDAIALSITTLKGKPRYQAIWWQLVDAHGRATGHMRYSQLWYALQKLLAYCEENRLHLNSAAWSRYLQQAENFNAAVFLERLTQVLKNAASQFDAPDIQQEILNKLDLIDWRHTGFYYASCYEAFPYWHSTFKLHPPLSPMARALRFACLNMKLSKKEFDQFEKVLRTSLQHPADERLLDQLRSIDFDHSSWLPEPQDLLNAFKEIHLSGEKADECRRQIVTRWIQKNTAICTKNAPFRILTPKESKEVGTSLNSYLKASFKQQNWPLCQNFIKNCLAINTDEPVQPQMEKLLRLLAYIDNKAHYNELGQVLGSLISTAKANGQNRRYSVPQLVICLESLINKNAYINQHYPVNLLNELLKQEQLSSLLNQDLNQLKKAFTKPGLDQSLQAIARLDLPNQYKIVFIKLLQGQESQQFLLDAEQLLLKLYKALVSPPWLNAIAELITSLPKEGAKIRQQILAELSQQWPKLPDDNAKPIFTELWQASQIKLSKLLVNAKISITDILTHFTDPYIKMILVQALGDWKQDEQAIWEKNKQQLPGLVAKLKKMNPSQLAELANYYYTKPFPSVSLLNDLLSKGFTSTEQLIHHFETVSQATNDNNSSKREYSLKNEDKQSLLRVLAGLKRKGKGFISDREQKRLLNLLFYANSYSLSMQLHTLPMAELNKCIQWALQDLKNTKDDKQQASARLLACIREIVLRKTGKWANHSQMLDLIYAAIYNDEHILHQVQPGQGKSLTTLIRSAYLALNGFIVDVFSAKESLSKRDHAEFAPVLEAMGIPHSYITAKSAAKIYHDKLTAAGIGAVNCATIGNFSLFQCKHIWKGQDYIQLDPQNRVAILDEADYVLNEEQTQFNFSDEDSEGIYNLDEWVYRVAYDFYLDHKDSFPINKYGLVTVSRHLHLPALFRKLQEQSIYSPKQSQFFKKYLNSALQNDAAALKKRDHGLKLLLSAAHIAHHLLEGKHFSIQSELKKVGGGMLINTHFAKVMIDSQIRQGSTYSDLVQQFLHVRLNKEAVEDGRAPDFFVDQNSRIALSQNAAYLLKKYYKKLEGCTGTGGDPSDLKNYESSYSIAHVIKVPSKEESQTVFLPTKYCDGETRQINAIVNQILLNTEQPLLITCIDDRDVKRISAKIRETLKQHSPNYCFDRFITDTNDSGKTEQDILPQAGDAGTVTISARLGRGTDIKPTCEKGLMVLRTYPAIPRITKQERGRQGRNGARGSCQDIIDYSVIKNAYSDYQTKFSARLNLIMDQQKQHLDEKLKKRRCSLHHPELDDDDTREKYLITRSVVQLIYENKQQDELLLRRKETLIASLSGQVMDVLHEGIKQKTSQNLTNIGNAWLECRSQIEALWNTRLASKQRDDENVYGEFFNKANLCWQTFCANNSSLLNAQIFTDFGAPSSLEAPLKIQRELPTQETDMLKAIDFYQQWLKGAEAVFDPKAQDPNISAIKAIFGPNYAFRDKFYDTLKNSSHHNDAARISKDLQTQRREKLFACLSNLFKEQSTAFYVSCQDWSDVIKMLTDQIGNENFDQYLNCIQRFFSQDCLKRKLAANLTADDIQKNGQLLKLVMKIEITASQTTEEFVENFLQAIYPEYWENFENNLLPDIEAIFTASPDSAATLIAHTNVADIAVLIDLLFRNRKSPALICQQSIARFKDYLYQNGAELKNSPNMIRPLFNLALSENQHNYLPKPLFFKSLGAEAEGKICYFLSQRAPITEANCLALYKLLSDTEDTALLNKEIVKPLISLPPYIPLDYILQQIRHAPGKLQLNDCITTLNAIRLAGKALNKFLLSRHVIESATQFKSTNFSGELSKWIAIFSRKTPPQNRVFFETILPFSTVCLPNLHLLSTAFNSAEMADQTELKNALNLAASIQDLSGERQNYVQSKFDQIFENYNEYGQHIIPLNVFSNSLKNSPDNLDTEEIDLLFLSDNDKSLIDKILLVYSNINEIESKYQLKIIRVLFHEFYAKITDKPKFIQRCLDFLVLFNKAENDCLDATTVGQLWQAYLSDNIRHYSQLEETIAATKIAMELNRNGKWNDYFFEFECPNRKKRQTIMQFLQHNLLKLDDERFKTRCYEEYLKMAKRLPEFPKNLNQYTSAKLHGLLKHPYQQLIKLTQEMETIAKHPYCKQNRRVNDGQNTILVNEIAVEQRRKYFEEQKQRYASFWWKNSVRKEQAKTMFKKLQEIGETTDSRANYYQNLLNTLMKSQQKILHSDMGTEHNSKGYSRLYDISVQMFITVARDYLADDDLEVEQKKYLSHLLQKQLMNHTMMLYSRLSSDFQDNIETDQQLSNLVAKLKPLASGNVPAWQAGSTELKGLGIQLAQIDRGRIPQQLVYLFDTLDCFNELSELSSTEQIITGANGFNNRQNLLI